MKAEPLLKTKRAVAEAAFVDIKVWHVPQKVRGSNHDLKYSLALVHHDECVLRYDNEADKGDHKHIGDREVAYRFVDLARLEADFWKDVEEWLRKNGTR